MLNSIALVEAESDASLLLGKCYAGDDSVHAAAGGFRVCCRQASEHGVCQLFEARLKAQTGVPGRCQEIYPALLQRAGFDKG